MFKPILNSSDATNAFAIIGLLAIIYIGLKILKKIAYGIWLYGTSSVVRFRRFGAWAVVTGATDGIGKAFCKAMANHGLNVVIVGRNPSKLAQVKEEMETQFPQRNFRTVQIDFSEGQEIYSTLWKATEQLEVGVLVNNVGIAYPVPNLMHELDEKFLLDIVRVNAISAVMCTHLYLPQMVTRNTGLIINVASSSAVLTVPYMAMYACTKSFVNAFTRNLAAEYRKTNIVVQGLLPFMVGTKMAAEFSDISRPSMTLPTPETYVKSALNLTGRVTTSFGCVGHGLQGFISKLLPESLAVALTAKSLEDQRERILAARAAE